MNFGITKKAQVVVFDGEHPVNAIITRLEAFPQGTADNPNPFIRAFAEEERTRTPFKFKLKPYGTTPRYYKDKKTGETRQAECEQIACCRALSRALGYATPCFDIELLLNQFIGSTVTALVKETPVLDDDGEIRRKDDGTAMVWHDVRLLAPAKEKEPTMPEKIAEAEAKRARKGKRGYAGNTGEA